jgi:acyl carrier protein
MNNTNITYIKTKIIRNPAIVIEVDTPLVSAWLIDSFALVDILVRLEEATQCKLPISQLSASELDTVRAVLTTAARLGRPLNQNMP